MSHTLLLADDSVTIQRVIELTFADEDIKVIAVGDGQQAISRINTDRPDVVLADIGMPEHDGYEVAAHVKRNPELAHIPVLLLTGAFEPVDETRARASGCDGVLVKPFEPQMVINRVKDLLAGRRSASAWGSPQQPAPARTGGPGDAPAEAPSPKQSGRRSSPEALDEYFDRLDAAFSSEAELPDPAMRRGAAEAAGERVEFGAWDVSLQSAEPAAPARMEVAVGKAAPSSTDPDLTAVFAALLAAEQRIASLADQPPAELPEPVIDEIVRRVTDRLDADVVRATVLEVAERLVREEIEKIKNG